MESINTVLDRMKENGEKPALFWNNKFYTYKEFLILLSEWEFRLSERSINSGSICAIVGDFSPSTCALFFALMKRKCIIVPYTHAIKNEIPAFNDIAKTEYLFEFNKEDNWTLTTILQNDKPELVKNFIKNESPGLIVFTSGSTGKPKGILHDCERVIKKFVEIRQSWITVLFLMMDHFGGFNTMLSSFAYGGVGVCLKDRTPEFVCNAIQESKATLLPTTPTFLNLLLASKCYLNYDLSSISLITYGTEMMSPTTLEKVLQVFPKASIKQTYGLSELGVLRSKSESDDSVWVKIGGSGFETKIVDNMLWVKSEANMIGYLNAPNPIDEKGWFNTGDVVEVKGEFIRFMGRKSEIINVGGQKVFPIEVESILLQAENIKEATVYGEKHPLMGNVVHARITLYKLEEHFALTERLRKFCIEKMAKYKVPLRFHIVSDGNQHNVRFKKIRK